MFLSSIEMVLKLSIKIGHILINFFKVIDLDSKNLDRKFNLNMISFQLKPYIISKLIQSPKLTEQGEQTGC